MARSLTKQTTTLKPIGSGTDDLDAVKLHHSAITIAEVRHKSNVIKIDQLASAVLPPKRSKAGFSGMRPPAPRMTGFWRRCWPAGHGAV